MKKITYYVYCDDVKKRDFAGNPGEMASNGYAEREYSTLAAAVADAKAMAKDATLDDDYLVYVEKITRELDDDGDVINEEDFEPVATLDNVQHIYEMTYAEDREKLAKIRDNIPFDGEAEELAVKGIGLLLETNYRYDETIRHSYLNCFELESEIRDISDNEELIEKAMKTFIATAEKVGIFELVHAGEY